MVSSGSKQEDWRALSKKINWPEKENCVSALQGFDACLAAAPYFKSPIDKQSCALKRQKCAQELSLIFSSNVTPKKITLEKFLGEPPDTAVMETSVPWLNSAEWIKKNEIKLK